MHPSIRHAAAALMLATAASVHAAPVLGLYASTDKIHPPEAFTIDVVLSGLRSPGGVTLLGGFDFVLDFDPHVARLTGWSFGTGLGDPDDALQTLVGADDVLAEFGRIGLFSVSLLEGRDTCFFCTGPYLDDLQGDSLTLASFQFESPGLAPTRPNGWTTEYLLPVGRVTLADELGNPITGVTTFGATVSVPEPATGWLLAAALVAARLARRPRGARHPTVGAA